MRVFTIITVVIAIVVGLFVLAGYFLPALNVLQVMLIDWAIIIAGWAVLVGIVNLLLVQGEKFRTRQKGGLYGLLLILAMLGTFLLGLVFGPDHFSMRLAVEAVIVPVEASLMAILAVTLIYASIRLLRRRVDVMSIVFLVVTLTFLFFTMSTIFGMPGDFVLNFLGMVSRGGARGLLIGIALGTLLTGLRVLFGVDRPYGGS